MRTTLTLSLLSLLVAGSAHALPKLSLGEIALKAAQTPDSMRERVDGDHYVSWLDNGDRRVRIGNRNVILNRDPVSGRQTATVLGALDRKKMPEHLSQTTYVIEPGATKATFDHATTSMRYDANKPVSAMRFVRTRQLPKSQRVWNGVMRFFGAGKKSDYAHEISISGHETDFAKPTPFKFDATLKTGRVPSMKSVQKTVTAAFHAAKGK